MKENFLMINMQDAYNGLVENFKLTDYFKSGNDFKGLDESVHYAFDDILLRTLLYSVRSFDDMTEVFVFSMNRLPDDLHYGFYKLFSDEFSEKNYKAIMEKNEAYMSGEINKADKLQTKNLYELPGMRASVLIKTTDAFYKLENNEFEEALKLFLELQKIAPIEEIDYTGSIALLYLILKKYDELEELNDTCETENVYLDYIYSFYLYLSSKSEDDILNASEMLRDAILGNPIVVELFRSLESVDVNGDEFNIDSLYEAELILSGIAIVVNNKQMADWFGSIAAAVLAEIDSDPDLKEALEMHYTNEDDGCGCGDDHCCNHDDDDEDDDEDDSKIIKLYDK